MAAGPVARPNAPGDVRFHVIDSLDHPHGGRILRLRLDEGNPPTLKELKGATLKLLSAEAGSEALVRVDGFALFGGTPSDERIRQAGRVDVHVFPEDPETDLSLVDAAWNAFLSPR